MWRIDESSMTVSRTPVQVGGVFGDEIEILGGLSPGDLLAVSGVHNLREGMQVRSLESSSSSFSGVFPAGRSGLMSGSNALSTHLA